MKDLERLKAIQNELKVAGIKIKEIEKLFNEVMMIASRNFEGDNYLAEHNFRAACLKGNRKQALELAKRWVSVIITALQKKN